MLATFIKAQNTEPLPVVNTEGENISMIKATQKQIDLAAKKKAELIKNNKGNNLPSNVFGGTDVLVNNNNGFFTTSRFTQSETSMLAFGNTVVVGFNDAGSFQAGTNHFTGYARSTDGGATFTDGGSLPNSTNGDAGDPVLARNTTTGRIYFSTLGFTSGNVIQMFRSDDNGVTWMAPVNAAPGGSSEDKQWITVDNFAGAGNGNVYMLSRRFGAGPGIYFFKSTDNGATFGPSGGTSIVSGFQGAFIEVGPDHSVYAFWWNGTTLQMRKSTDQGATFAAAVTVATGLVGGTNGDLALTGIRQGTVTASGFRSSEFPHVAVNPVSGHLYVTFPNNPAGIDKADIFMVMSTDGGATWGAAVKVNDDATTTDQWQPTIAVTPDGLNLGIFYYSREEDAANNNLFKYHGRLATISGATVTFGASSSISDVGSLPEFGRDAVVNSTYMGDYNQAIGTANGFSLVWSDNRDDLAGGAGRKDPNVYFSSINLCTPPVITAPTVTQPTCTTPTGTIVVNATGTGALEYSLDNSVSWQPGSTFSGLAPGSYNIAVRLISTPACSATYSGNPVVINPVVTSFTCPANITENITGIGCTKQITTPNPTANCFVITNLTWALTGATIGNSPATGIYYVGTRTFRAGTTTVTYTATNAIGSILTCSFTVKALESIPPEIRCPLDKTVYADPGVCTKAVVVLGTPIVSDNCGIASVTNNAPAIYQPGSNFVTWTVTDHSGNTRTCVQEIFVADNQKPTITCPANIIQSTGPVCAATPVNTANPVFSDNCAVVKLTWAMTGVSWGTSPNTGINYVGERNFATGLSRITYAATDAAGNTQTCTFTVTVKDNTAPTLTCPADQTLCKVANNTYSIPLLSATDNCDIALTNFKVTGATTRSGSGLNASGIFNLGVSTVAWTVKDVAGNVSNCSILVNVLPTTHPGCTTPGFVEPVTDPKFTEVTVQVLSINAWPNPADNFFNLKVNSPVKETVEIRMFDMKGKLLQQQSGTTDQTYRFGEHALSGMYIIEARQAGKTVRTKVVKQ